MDNADSKMVTPLERIQREISIRLVLLVVLVVGLLYISDARTTYNFQRNRNERNIAVKHRDESDAYTWDLLKSLGAKTDKKQPIPLDTSSY